MANVYYEKDADRSVWPGARWRCWGTAPRATLTRLNLKDSGIDVRVGLRAGSSSMAKAEAAGLRVVSTADAAREADVIMMLLPDTEIGPVYDSEVAPNLSEGDALFFAHGFNVRFGAFT